MDNTLESANRIYSIYGICPTIPTCGGGGHQPKILDMEEDMGEKRYRIRKLTPIECGRLMGVSDSDIIRMIISDHNEAEKFLYELKRKGIRYKGRREFDDAIRIQRMSNTQLYKQFGNSIVVPVLMAIFSQLGIQGAKKWNDMTEDEIYETIEEHR